MGGGERVRKGRRKRRREGRRGGKRIRRDTRRGESGKGRVEGSW